MAAMSRSGARSGARPDRRRRSVPAHPLSQGLTCRDAAHSGDRTQTYLVPGENPLDQASRTFAALEIACLDLIGKAVGKPVCDVIGGRARDEVTFSAYLFYKHGGGGGVGDDAREDEYGEVLDAARDRARDQADDRRSTASGRSS